MGRSKKKNLEKIQIKEHMDGLCFTCVNIERCGFVLPSCSVRIIGNIYMNSHQTHLLYYVHVILTSQKSSPTPKQGRTTPNLGNGNIQGALECSIYFLEGPSLFEYHSSLVGFPLILAKNKVNKSLVVMLYCGVQARN